MTSEGTPFPDQDSPPQHLPSQEMKPEHAGGGSKTSAGGTWQPPAPEELQEEIPACKVLELLGRGGMGAVYKGWQISLERPVAIKVLPPHISAEVDGEFVARFQQEAKTMARFVHPGIVAVFDAGKTSRGLLYIVMEFVEGTDLARMIKAKGRLSAEEALTVTAQVCDALAYAHGNGVIHRDVKPANIMVSATGQVKVADFGLAKSSALAGIDLTRTDMSMGTPDFIAPEALLNTAAVDHRADLFAVGVMLYNMLTGEIPRGLFQMPGRREGGDARFDAVIARAMQMDPAQRYQSAAEFRRDLDAVRTTPIAKLNMDQPLTPDAIVAHVAPDVIPPIRAQRANFRIRFRTAWVVALAAALLAGAYVKWFPVPAKTNRAKNLSVRAPASTQPLDLIATIDPARDVNKDERDARKAVARKEGGKLIFESEGPPLKVKAPVSVFGDEYELALRITQHSGGYAHLEIPTDPGEIASVRFESGGRVMLQMFKTSVLVLDTGREWSRTTPVVLKVHVKRGAGGAEDELTVSVNDVEGAPWRGRLSPKEKNELSGARWPYNDQAIASLYVQGTIKEVDAFTLRMIRGVAKVLAESAAPGGGSD